jgi:putative ABC transport system permease protein
MEGAAVSLWYRLAGLFPSLLSALRNVSRAKVRSGLAAAAIFIGVVSIAIVGAGGEAFKQSQLQNIESQGATYVFVSPGLDNEQGYFTREDLREIQETVGSTGVVATTSRDGEWQQRVGETEQVSISYMGSAEMLETLYTVDRGEVPLNWRQEAVVSGSYAAENNLSVDDRMRIQLTDDENSSVRTYRVVAILTESGGFGGSDVYLPISMLDERQYTQVQVLTDSASRAEATAELLREEFNGRKDRLLVFELTNLLRLFTSIVNGINTFLLGVGGIALVVAGISITNTMLMAVIRRREEIGVLRAVGYQRIDIVRILLIEAAVLGALGAGAGVGVALPFVMLANSVFLGDPFAFSTTALAYLVAAFAFGVTVSLVAGAYPAWRAANERPVDALRG